ncbi:hypothetical protein CVT25_013310 [Psilocybe cyanescens]|uniref:Uncharacterized protein n=1 Tax=Psilocybe cyanescens TaxID=93625 RepID=A0A409XWP9_PSICY|nr:hypothetical protein CVT25_013310 [Psilocybe cyanescens]
MLGFFAQILHALNCNQNESGDVGTDADTNVGEGAFWNKVLPLETMDSGIPAEEAAMSPIRKPQYSSRS